MRIGPTASWIGRHYVLVSVLALLALVIAQPFVGFVASELGLNDQTKKLPRANAQQERCMQAALSNNLIQLQSLQSKDMEALRSKDMQENLSMLSVERTIAERRLQEQYCMQFTQCLLPAENVGSPNVGVAFSNCLEDELREQYELPPRERWSRKPKR